MDRRWSTDGATDHTCSTAECYIIARITAEQYRAPRSIYFLFIYFILIFFNVAFFQFTMKIAVLIN